jgi:hypothetical protein
VTESWRDVDLALRRRGPAYPPTIDQRCEHESRTYGKATVSTKPTRRWVSPLDDLLAAVEKAVSDAKDKR